MMFDPSLTGFEFVSELNQRCFEQAQGYLDNSRFEDFDKLYEEMPVLCLALWEEYSDNRGQEKLRKMKYGYSLVHSMCLNGSVEALEHLIRKKPDLFNVWVGRREAKYEFPGAPLNSAVGKGHLEVVKFYIEKELTISQMGECYDSPLIAACRVKEDAPNALEIMKLLVDNSTKAQLDYVPDDHQPALAVALRYGHLEYVKLLVAAGASIEVSNEDVNAVVADYGQPDLKAMPEGYDFMAQLNRIKSEVEREKSLAASAAVAVASASAAPGNQRARPSKRPRVATAVAEASQSQPSVFKKPRPGGYSKSV